MARKKDAKPPPPVEESRPKRRPLIRSFATLIAIVALLASIVWVGLQAASKIQSRSRYTLAFTDIECDVPAGLDKNTFLAEVRYLSDFPETFPAHDPPTQERIREAFRKHPWVEHVQGGYLTVGKKYPLDVIARVPVLAVRVRDGIPLMRIVTASGILLPAGAVPGEIAVLAGEVPSPLTPAGQVWNDPIVKRAAELAKEYPSKRIEKSERGWRITRTIGPVLTIER